MLRLRVTSKPGKVRKLAFTASNKMLSARLRATLLPELRSAHGVRSARVRKGDTVKILRGEYKGVEGKVTQVYPSTGRISVEGVTREKLAGGTVPVKIHASKMVLTALDLSDSLRRSKFQGSSSGGERNA